MLNYEKKFKEYLAEKNLKYTLERKIILNGVFSLHEHFNVDALYDYLAGQDYNISRATIYRTINLLVDSKLIAGTCNTKGKGNFEHIYGHQHHDHLICLDCGKIIEYSDEHIEKAQEDICKKFNFQPVEHSLSIKGYCEKCRKSY